MTPCKDCEKRHLGCHADCKEYNDWHNDIVAQSEQRRKILHMEGILDASRKKNYCSKLKRRKR